VVSAVRVPKEFRFVHMHSGLWSLDFILQPSAILQGTLRFVGLEDTLNTTCPLVPSCAVIDCEIRKHAANRRRALQGSRRAALPEEAFEAF